MVSTAALVPSGVAAARRPNFITHLQFAAAFPASRSPGMGPALHVRMLRITQVRLTASVVTLKVEGRVAADWVQVLEEECRRHTGDGRDVQLDFTEVSMVACDGIAMLRRLTHSRIEIVKAPPLIRALLAEEECR
jgi:hypothetical protein